MPKRLALPVRQELQPDCRATGPLPSGDRKAVAGKSPKLRLNAAKEQSHTLDLSAKHPTPKPPCASTL
jgi:hypothetical protein